MKSLAVWGTLWAITSGLQAEEKSETIKVVYETFSLPMGQAAAILRSGITDQKVYQKMVEGVRAQEVNLETFMVGRGMIGQNLTIEQIVEFIYNTEASRPVIPAKFTYTVGPGQETDGKRPKPFFPMIPVTPTSFDTKNTGNTLELEARLAAEKGTIDLRITPTWVAFTRLDHFGQGASTVAMPRFAVQQLKTGVTVPEGEPSFLGATNPPDSLQPEGVEKRIWFSFITVTLISF